jgi:hypothetical protein
MLVQPGYRKRFFLKTISCITLIAFFTACSVHKFPDYSQVAIKIPNYQVKKDVALACEPFTEKQKIETYFGVDLLREYADGEQGYAILPIYLTMENMGKDSVLLKYPSIQFLSKENKVIMSAVDGPTAGTPCERAIEQRNYVMGIINIFWLILPVIPLIALPFLSHAIVMDQSAVFSMNSKVLSNRSLAGGQKLSGFTFFLIKNEQIATLLNVDSLQMNVKNLETNEEITFNFSMSFSELRDRLMPSHNSGQSPPSQE